MPSQDILRKLIEQHPELLKRGGVFRRAPVHESHEWLRIVGLPRRALALKETPDLSPLWAKPDGRMKLWPIQSAALLEAERANGLFAMMPVSAGKTLLAVLLPEALKARKAVILVPAQSKRKKLEQVWPALQEHWQLPLDRITLVSYSELERAPGDVLERIEPDLIIADEAHSLKHPQSARTARFLRYFKERPATRLCAMSGTFTKESIEDYAHIIRLALKDSCPLPRDYLALQEWAEALDVTDNPRPSGALDRLCEVKDHVHQSTRDRFACRLASTPGVVALASGFTGVALSIRGRTPALPSKVTAAVERLRRSWEVGEIAGPEEAAEEVRDHLEYARYLRQLSLGFYLRFAWPGGKPDREWIDARAKWSGVVRHLLRYCRAPGFDSPLLVANAAKRGDLNKEHTAAWQEWAAVKERKAPPTRCVWIDKYAVEEALAWAKAAPGIIWTEHTALNDAISEALGIRQPENAADIPLDGSTVVLTLHRFRQDLDGLQHVHWRNLYTSIPNAEWLEQSLGRTHREGQRRDVEVELLLPVPESREYLESVKADAEYMQTTGFGAQKLLNCEMEIK